MSALPQRFAPIATEVLCCYEVPGADIGSLFDRVVAAGEQRRRRHFDGEIAPDDDWIRLESHQLELGNRHIQLMDLLA